MSVDEPTSSPYFTGTYSSVLMNAFNRIVTACCNGDIDAANDGLMAMRCILKKPMRDDLQKDWDHYLQILHKAAKTNGIDMYDTMHIRKYKIRRVIQACTLPLLEKITDVFNKYKYLEDERGAKPRNRYEPNIGNDQPGEIEQ